MIRTNLKFLFLILGLVIISGCTQVINETQNVLSYEEKNLLNGNTYSINSQFELNHLDAYYFEFNSQSNLHLISRMVCANTISGNQLHYEVNIYENGDSSGGTQIESFNNLRDSPKNSSTIIFKNVNPNLTNSNKLPFGNKVISDKSVTDLCDNTIPYILKPNVNYYVEIKNLNNALTNFSINWLWIES